MNYPDLIWRLIEIALQKEKQPNHEIDKINENIFNAKKQDETE